MWDERGKPAAERRRILPGSSWRMSNALSCKYYFTLSFAFARHVKRLKVNMHVLREKRVGEKPEAKKSRDQQQTAAGADAINVKFPFGFQWVKKAES